MICPSVFIDSVLAAQSSAGREVFSLFHKDTCLETETHPWPQNDADFPRGPDDKWWL